MTNNSTPLSAKTFFNANPPESKSFYLGCAFFAVPLITYFVMSGAFLKHIAVFLVVTVLIIAFLTALCVKNRKNIRGTATVFVIIFLAFTSSFCTYMTGYDNASRLVKEIRDERHTFAGYVVIEDAETSAPMFVKLTELDGRLLKVPVMTQCFNCTGFYMAVGTYIEFDGKIRLSEEKESKFNEYRKSKGVHTVIYSMKNPVLDSTKDNTSVVSGIRSFFKKSLLNVLKIIPEKDKFERAYSVSCAMLLGNKGELDSEAKEDFSRSGIIHILCVSGLHFSVMLGCLSIILKYTVKNRTVWNIVLIVCAVIYLAVCGFTRSALRAAVMSFISAIGISKGKRSYCTHVLLLAVCIICIADPNAVFDSGFRMSCICCVGILCSALVTEAVDKRFSSRPVICILLSSFIISLSASSFLMPYSLTAFDGVSTVSVIASTIAVLPAQFFLMLCWSCIALSGIMPGFLRIAAASIISGFTELLCGIARFFSDLRYAYISIDMPDFSFLIFMIIIGVAALVINSKSRALSWYVCFTGFSAAATAVLLVVSETIL